MFEDRRDAGRRLAERLRDIDAAHAVVLALPRGGVTVADEIATAIGAPLGLLMVRKIGLPGHRELALGAIAHHRQEARIINADVATAAGLTEAEIETLTQRARDELMARARVLQSDAPHADLAGKTVILVDDGIATGATMRAAIAAARSESAREIVVAVPVGAPDTVADIAAGVERMVCLSQPHLFRSVGEHYLRFHQVTDKEVRDMLARSGAR